MLFFKKAKAERLARFKTRLRKVDRARVGFDQRRQCGLIAFAVMMLFPVSTMVIVELFETITATPDRQALLFWGRVELGNKAVAVILSGVIVAVLTSVWAAYRGTIRSWIGLPIAIMALASLTLPWLANTTATYVYTDRVEIRGRDVTRLPLTQVRSVDVGCRLIRSSALTSNDRYIATLDYVLWFDHGRAVDLAEGRGRSTESRSRWLRSVVQLDHILADQGVARVLLTDEAGNRLRSPGCVRGLGSDLPPADLAAVRRALAIGEDDLHRFGIDPRGLW